MSMFGDVSEAAPETETTKVRQHHEPAPITDQPTFPRDHLDIINPKTGEKIGELIYPTEFCEGVGCPYATGKHPYSYHRPQGTLIWVHSGCGKPTKSHCSGTVRDQIIVMEGKSLPWE